MGTRAAQWKASSCLSMSHVLVLGRCPCYLVLQQPLEPCERPYPVPGRQRRVRHAFAESAELVDIKSLSVLQHTVFFPRWAGRWHL